MNIRRKLGTWRASSPTDREAHYEGERCVMFDDCAGPPQRSLSFQPNDRQRAVMSKVDHWAADVPGNRNVAGCRTCHAGGVMVRCLIVDDSLRFLDAARALLERQGVEVIGVATTGVEALQQTRALRPDVTLVDIDLGGESGFDVAERLREDANRAPVILISTH